MYPNAALHIDVYTPVNFLDAMTEKRMTRHDASIVDDYVNVGNNTFYFLGLSFYFFLLRNITTKSISLTTNCYYFFGGFLSSLQINIPTNYSTTKLGKLKSNFSSNTTPCTCNLLDLKCRNKYF